jgi:hypothetical protein
MFNWGYILNKQSEYLELGYMQNKQQCEYF